MKRNTGGIDYLSYSGFKSYIGCNFAYWNKYVNDTVLTTPENSLGTLYGTVVGLVFETFYRDKIWKRDDCIPYLQCLVRPYYTKAVQDLTRQGRIVDWTDENATNTYKSPADVINDAIDTIPRGIQTIRQYRLMGPIMEAEMKLDYRFGKYLIGGRADFVVRRVKPHGDLVILDGKGSKHREKYVDGHYLKPGQAIEGTQLKWYSFLYKQHKGVSPDAVGYIFWKFGGLEAMEWVPFDASDLTNLKDEVLATVSRIDVSVSRLHKLEGKPQECDDLRQELFPAQAGEGCKMCPYVPVCEEGQKKTRVRKPRIELPDGVTELTLGMDD